MECTAFDVVINTVTTITVYAHCCRNVLRESGNPMKFSLATIVCNVGGKKQKNIRRDDNDDCAVAAIGNRYYVIILFNYYLTVMPRNFRRQITIIS